MSIPAAWVKVTSPYKRGYKYYIARKAPRKWHLMYHVWYQVPQTIGTFSTYEKAIRAMDVDQMVKQSVPLNARPLFELTQTEIEVEHHGCD